jgi:hypothetical protein
MHPEDGYGEAADQGEEAYRTGCTIVGVFEGVENNQGQPAHSKNTGQTKLGREAVGAVENVIENDDEQTDDHDGHFEIHGYARAVIDNQRRRNEQEATNPEDAQDNVPPDFAPLHTVCHDTRLLSMRRYMIHVLLAQYFNTASMLLVL